MRVWDLLGVATTLGAAASGGAFLTYSGFTTAVLAKLPADHAMAVMQQINRAASRPASFMAVLFAPGVASALLATHALVTGQPGTGWTVAAAGVHLVGVVVVTAGHHVPRNQTLAILDPTTQTEHWPSWLQSWVAVNHVRTLSGLTAATLLAASLRHSG